MMANNTLAQQQVEKVRRGEESPAITVGAKRTMEYAVDCAAWFNRGPQEITLKSFEQSISKAAEVSQILAGNLGIQILSTSIRQVTRKGTKFTCMETILKCVDTLGEKADFIPDPETEFVEFPIYHLLLDSLLGQKRKLIIGNYSGSSSSKPSDRFTQLLTVTLSQRGFRCTPGQDLLQIIGKKTGEDRERRQNTLGNLVSAFCRCGLVLSPHWDEISLELSEYDDVVLGVDTNILYDCSITQQLLDGFVFAGPVDHLHTPNWVLIVVPSAVMHEIEQAANSRDKNGFFTFQGRMGYRALQEILELDRSKDIVGASLLIAGEANPVLDTRVELRGLREDMKEAAPPAIQPRLFRKLSAGDTIIRDQFKSFLHQINFHKGAFFITSDKSNAALAQAEGLHSIYYQTPPWNTLLLLGQKVEPPSIDFESESTTLSIPFGKLIYELAIQFGEICICWEADEIRLRCDSKGESLDHWVNRDLQINSRDLKKLTADYNAHGRVSLARVSTIWRGIGGNLMGWL